MHRARLSTWLPPGRTARRLVVASFVDSTGTGLYIAGSALFFTRVLGLSVAEVGVGLSLSGIAGVLGVMPVGWLADRMGGKRALVLLYLWRGAGFLVYPFVQGPAMFYVVAFLIGIAEWSSGPIVQAIVGASQDTDSRVRTMAVIAAVRNAGFTIGALLATLAVATEEPSAFSALVFADAATFLIAALMLSRLPVSAGVKAARRQVAGAITRVRDPRFLALTGLNGVLYLHSVLLTVGVPLWISTRTEAPLAVVGVVVVVNTVLAIVLQVPLSRGSEDVRSGARRQQWAGWCLAGCCLLLAAAAGVGSAGATALVVLAVIGLTLGEIWQSVGAWRLSYALAPEDKRTYYFSVFQLGLSASHMVGPALVTYVVIRNGTAGWVGLAAVFVLAGLATVLVARSTAPV